MNQVVFIPSTKSKSSRKEKSSPPKADGGKGTAAAASTDSALAAAAEKKLSLSSSSKADASDEAFVASKGANKSSKAAPAPAPAPAPPTPEPAKPKKDSSKSGKAAASSDPASPDAKPKAGKDAKDTGNSSKTAASDAKADASDAKPNANKAGKAGKATNSPAPAAPAAPTPPPAAPDVAPKKATKVSSTSSKAAASSAPAGGEKPLLSSTAIDQMAEATLKEAEVAEKAASNPHTTFERRMGAALIAKIDSMKPDPKEKDKQVALIRKMDKNNDGELNKMEFRTAVRTELQVKADNKEIDEFFSALDADKNDSLDVNELKVAFKQIIDAARGAADEAALMRNKAAQIREKVAFIKGVAEATRACEHADARFAELRGVKGVDARIGEKIISRNLKVAEVMTKWDKSGDGSLEADEFRSAVLELGVEATPAEIDSLFVKLDTDGGGAIDVSELRTFVTKLTDAAKNAATEVKELEKSTLALRKAATKAQKDLTTLKTKEVKEAKEGELVADEAAKATQGAKADDKAKKKEEKAAKKKGAAAPS